MENSINHSKMCPNRGNVGYVTAPIECPECKRYGYHPTSVCDNCGYAACECVRGDGE